MKTYIPLEQRSPRRILLSLLTVAVMLVTLLSSGMLSQTTHAADMVIGVGESNGYASAELLRNHAFNGNYAIEDSYGTIWGTETQVEIFKSEYHNGEQKITVAGRNNEKVIAPGTENTYTFAVKNLYSGWLDYKITVEAFVEGLEGVEGAPESLPVEARLQGQKWLVGNENEFCPVLELDGATESAVLAARKQNTYTLQWQWPFERDLDGDGNVDDGDAVDTWLANQSEPISLTIRIVVLSTYHTPGVSSVSGSIPEKFDTETHIAYLYGYPDGTIRPETDITRAEVAAILFRLLREDIREEYRSEECVYSDVVPEAWYLTEVCTLTRLGLLEGYPDGTFRGDAPITRAELATVLARISEVEISGDGKTGFSDIDRHWAKAEIMTIEDFGWIEGYPDGTFGPDRNVTRAETATMINRMLHRCPEQLDDLLEEMKVWPDNLDVQKWYYLAIQEATNSHNCSRLLGNREKWTDMLWDISEIH